MADQPQLEFNNLPTEALFSFFFALDPLTIGKIPPKYFFLVFKNYPRCAREIAIIIEYRDITSYY